jgi:hypothetical protein
VHAVDFIRFLTFEGVGLKPASVSANTTVSADYWYCRKKYTKYTEMRKLLQMWYKRWEYFHKKEEIPIKHLTLKQRCENFYKCDIKDENISTKKKKYQ